jgi:transposase-like protein
MRLKVSEKQEIIHMVTRSEIGVNRTLREIGINKSTFRSYLKLPTPTSLYFHKSNSTIVQRKKENGLTKFYQKISFSF